MAGATFFFEERENEKYSIIVFIKVYGSFYVFFFDDV